MSTSSLTPPIQITPSMIPLVAAVDIDRGDAISFVNGLADLQDNSDFSNVFPAIGVAANKALAGDMVYVQVSGVITVQTLNTCFPGNWVGSNDGVPDPTMSDLGLPVNIVIQNEDQFSVCGYCISVDGESMTMLICPYYIPTGQAITPPVLPNFADNETPSTFTTNSEYVLANAPNPRSSLMVFVDDTISGTDGCNKLLIQGDDYHIGGAGNNHIIYDAPPIITNKIQCWYRF